MYKTIFKVFALIVDVYLSMRLATYALLLADRSSDNAVLGAIGILLLLVLVNTFIVRYLFSNTKEKNTNAQ